MNTQLETFSFQSHELRIITDETGTPLFIAKDVAEILDYSDAEAMTRKLDKDEIQNRQIVGFGNRGVNLINESGLYSSILRSTKPEAKVFKKWVTSEVLPSIRKHGAYIGQNSKSSTHFDDGILIDKDEYIGLLKYKIEVLRRSQPQPTQTVLPDFEPVPSAPKVKPTGRQQFEVLLALHLEKLKADGANNNAIKASRSSYRKEYNLTGKIPDFLHGEETRGRPMTLSADVISRFEELAFQSADRSNPSTFISDAQRTVRVVCTILEDEFKQTIAHPILYNYVNNHPALQACFPKVRAGV